MSDGDGCFEPLEPYPIEPGDLVHDACGTVVLHYDRPLLAGDMLRAEYATNPDGTPSLPGHLIWCNWCGRTVHLDELSQRGTSHDGLGCGRPHCD